VRSAKFDLLLAVEESAAGLTTVWEYDADPIGDTTSHGWTRRFDARLAVALTSPDQALSALVALAAPAAAFLDDDH
jgi:phage terminase large subunit-like protein